MSISRQCALLGISRSSVYYRPRGESAESLALMRRMDAFTMLTKPTPVQQRSFELLGVTPQM
ncbi:MAG: hypothetical protein F4X11_17725 [Acidobacteria bacterium]|nr:hypothetical protein [Acidobacteriota bacterium]